MYEVLILVLSVGVGIVSLLGLLAMVGFLLGLANGSR